MPAARKSRAQKDTEKMQELARRHGVGALNTLKNIMDDKGAPAPARVAAANAILDRGFGKTPTASAPNDPGSGGNPIHIKLNKTDSEL